MTSPFSYLPLCVSANISIYAECYNLEIKTQSYQVKYKTTDFRFQRVDSLCVCVFVWFVYNLTFPFLEKDTGGIPRWILHMSLVQKWLKSNFFAGAK